MPDVLALWTHLLAAALYGALAVAQLLHWKRDRLARPLVAAFAIVAVWAVFLAFLDPHHLLTRLAESGRNLAFLAFMYGLLNRSVNGPSQRAVMAVYGAVAGVVGLQIILGGVIWEYHLEHALLGPLVSTAQILGITIAAGSLILVHNLYGQAAPASRSALRLPMIALGVMWAYDLHFYTLDHFTAGEAQGLASLRGLLLALIAPLFALAMRSRRDWKVQISRAATFQSIGIVAILVYLVVMLSASRLSETFGGGLGQVAQLGLIAVVTAVALLLLLSVRARNWFRVTLTKHMFEHRYDYRAEWLRFTDTVGRQGETPLAERVVKAIADIGGSSSGLLLTADRGYRLTPATAWQWTSELPPTGDGAEGLVRYIEETGHVLDFDTIRSGTLDVAGRSIPVPDWLSGLPGAWAGIPLIHADCLVGLVILGHPPVRRPLDWEDFDLFRAAGIQAASYIAEARGQQALADSRRFDEFNRRFAFILHDVKNLVSQLSLVARNAERHADNPEFRADMIATLQASVRKLNDLLARLSPGATRESDPLGPVDIASLVGPIAASRRRSHPVLADGIEGLVAIADRSGLELAIGHLVQNAVEASPPDRPVRINWFESGGDVAIEVQDQGTGMSDEFVRDRLFQPFVSTKESGFGIGAYEARTIIAAMGGHLDVESEIGVGTRFTIFLPADTTRLNFTLERMRA